MGEPNFTLVMEIALPLHFPMMRSPYSCKVGELKMNGYYLIGTPIQGISEESTTVFYTPKSEFIFSQHSEQLVGQLGSHILTGIYWLRMHCWQTDGQADNISCCSDFILLAFFAPKLWYLDILSTPHASFCSFKQGKWQLLLTLWCWKNHLTAQQAICFSNCGIQK